MPAMKTATTFNPSTAYRGGRGMGAMRHGIPVRLPATPA